MATVPKAGEGEIRDRRVAFLVRDAGIGLAGLLGVVALIRLVLVRSYNYDELSHAHMTWLVSVGEVPYRDFAANHFPFLWMILSPAMWVLPGTPGALMVLRGLALLLNAVFVGALATLICIELQPKERLWAVVCLGSVVFCPLDLHYLIEFRPDAVANALLFSTLAWLRLRGLRHAATALLSGFCIGVALLINTKYVLFPFVLGAVALGLYARELRQVWRFALALCLGFGVALLGGVLLARWIGVSLDDAWRMVVTYNGLAAKAQPFGFGLARKLTQYPVWLGYTVAGLTGWAFLSVRQRRPPDLMSIAICLFLVLNLVTTTKPWKQYLASWLLLAAWFPARSLPLLLARLGPPAQAAGAGCVLAVIGVGLAQAGFTDPDGGAVDRATQDRVMTWICQRVPPDGFVVCSYYLHPVFRRDTFFKTVVDIAPNVGDGLEEFMPRLVPSPYAEHFQQSGYEKELELRPPSLLVVDPAYTVAQLQALNAWQIRHPGVYAPGTVPGTRVTVLLRKADR